MTHATSCTWCRPCHASLCDCGPCSDSNCRECYPVGRRLCTKHLAEDLLNCSGLIVLDNANCEKCGPVKGALPVVDLAKFFGNPELPGWHPGCPYYADEVCNKCGWVAAAPAVWNDEDSEGAGGDGSL